MIRSLNSKVLGLFLVVSAFLGLLRWAAGLWTLP
jgi:hypothetical protein